jgi:hypothetical protein
MGPTGIFVMKLTGIFDTELLTARQNSQGRLSRGSGGVTCWLARFRQAICNLPTALHPAHNGQTTASITREATSVWNSRSDESVLGSSEMIFFQKFTDTVKTNISQIMFDEILN